MFAFGFLLFVAWILLHVFEVAVDIAELVLKVAIVLMVVGGVLDLFTRGRLYSWLRK